MKPHWERLINIIEMYQNGKVIIDFQDGLPVKIREIEGSNKDIDLTTDK